MTGHVKMNGFVSCLVCCRGSTLSRRMFKSTAAGVDAGPANQNGGNGLCHHLFLFTFQMK